MSTVQSLNLAIISNDPGVLIQSVLNFNANDPIQNMTNLINFLNGVVAGAYGSIKVTATLPDASEVVFTYGVVVSATPTPTVTRTPTVTPSVTASATVTPTVTPTMTVTPSITRSAGG